MCRSEDRTASQFSVSYWFCLVCPWASQWLCSSTSFLNSRKMRKAMAPQLVLPTGFFLLWLPHPRHFTRERFTNVCISDCDSQFVSSFNLPRLVSFPFTPRSPPPQSLLFPNGLSGTSWAIRIKGEGVSLQPESLSFITFKYWASLRISVFQFKRHLPSS